MFSIYYQSYKPNKKENMKKVFPDDIKNVWKCGNFFYRSNTFIFNVLRVFGMFPWTTNASGRFVSSWRSFPTIYAFVTSFSTGIVTISLIIYEAYSMTTVEDMGYGDAILLVCFLISSFAYLIPCLIFLERKGFATFLNDISDFEVNFLQVTGKTISNVPSKTVSNRIRFLTCLVLSISIYYGGFDRSNILIQQDTPKINFLPSVFETLHLKAVFCVWPLVATMVFRRTMCGAVAHAADCLIGEIEAIFRFGNPPQDLSQHYKLWLHLRELCQSIGYIMPATFTAICLTMFLLCLPSTYMFALGSIRGQFWALLPALLTGLYLSLILEISHRVVSKVGESFKSRLTRLLIVQKFGGAPERSLKKFLNEITANPPVMTQAGCFTLHRGTNISLYSSLVTYFIIMLQFKGSSEESE